MSDKELLEKAARAAGNGAVWRSDDAFRLYAMVLPNGQAWNPLDDDGDAFRLAADLELNVFHAAGNAYAMPSDSIGDNEQVVSYRDVCGKHEATRRAIVLAAAMEDR